MRGTSADPAVRTRLRNEIADMSPFPVTNQLSGGRKYDAEFGPLSPAPI